MIVLYLMIPAYMGLLYILSAEEKLPTGLPADGVSTFFNKIAAFLYRRFLKKSKSFYRSPSRKNVERGLKALNSKKDVEKEQAKYYIKKISMALMLITAGSIIAALCYFQSRRSDAFDENGFLIRNDYDKREMTRTLTAAGEGGEQYGDFDLLVKERAYTKKQAEELLAKMLKELPEIILGENEDLSHVEKDLNLVTKVPGYPFEISWKTDDIDVIHSDGKVDGEGLTDKGALVILTAEISYLDYKWEHEFFANVYEKELTGAAFLQKEIQKELTKAEENTREDASFKLPEEVFGKRIIFAESIDDNSFLILLLVIISAVLIFVFQDKELDKEVENRRKKLILDYPQFISRLVLYMGAGMSVRAIFELFSEEYKKDLESGSSKSFLYEEIRKASNELQSGVSELSVYERLGIRCGAQQYTRLVTLLSQNLKKGNSELSYLLREEADKAVKERMSYARKLGEEAGTKLLLPMIMMLLIVMIVIMVPAYLSF
ncbi:immunoglobulin-like domain-containing protein [Butyrivibrio sp. AE3006]|uniref:immunoglobulin-like domain-containing protein n=1 Tax=Butyrivibrio sp. AE3006 TaxID=1280673 RepID=UPI00041694C4|nr:immunoglobulin-like domain-containing protein [Butyrivibrio sp. AE3006]